MKKYIFVVLVYALVIYLSLAANPVSADIKIPRFRHADKVVHFGFYAFIAFTSWWALRRSPLSKTTQYLLILIVPILIGAMLELMQHYLFPKRSGEWLDFAANTVGAFSGYIVARMLLPR